jgi:BirA family transcriptional regulator, biotin operon repressor / biotin---[acetyl-CoA-carboxylase] ligase
MRLDPAAVTAGVQVIWFDRIASTNAQALDRARVGERGPIWIVADMQTAGRGRHGRPWVSEAGNLYATLLLRDPAPPPRTPELAFVAGLAVHDAVAETTPELRERLTLKWPNDLLCDGAKLGGILIEGEGAEHFAVAIGIGVNCRQHPVATDYPATNLMAAGAAVAPETLFCALSRTMLQRLEQWDRGAGFTVIRAAWMQRAGALGRELRVRITGGEVRGRYEGLDASGRLLLRCADGGVHAVGAGDVFPASPLAAGAA